MKKVFLLLDRSSSHNDLASRDVASGMLGGMEQIKGISGEKRRERKKRERDFQKLMRVQFRRGGGTGLFLAPCAQ